MKLALITVPGVYPVSPPSELAQMKSYLLDEVETLEIKTIDLSLTFDQWLLQEAKDKVKNNQNDIEKKKLSEFITSFEVQRSKDRSQYNLKTCNHYAYVYIDHMSRELKKINDDLVSNSNENIPSSGGLPRFIKAIEAEKPDMVVFFARLKHQFPITMALARYFKNKLNRFVVLIGNFALNDSLTQNWGKYQENYDQLILGDALDSLKRTVLTYPCTENIPKTFVPENRDIVYQADIPQNIENMPFPNYDDIDLKQYLVPHTIVPISLSYGCQWNKCSFCTYKSTYSKIKSRSINRVVNELEFLKEKYNIFHFDFYDSWIPPKKLKSLCEEILHRKLHVRFMFMARPIIDYEPEILDLSFQAGGRYIFWGVESGSQRMLNLMNKGTKVEDIDTVIRRSHAAGIHNWVFSMKGFPGETAQDLSQTITLLKNLTPYLYGVAIRDFALSYATTIYNQPEKFGIEILPFTDKQLKKIPYIEQNKDNSDQVKEKHQEIKTVCDEINKDKNLFSSVRYLLFTCEEQYEKAI